MENLDLEEWNVVIKNGPEPSQCTQARVPLMIEYDKMKPLLHATLAEPRYQIILPNSSTKYKGSLLFCCLIQPPDDTRLLVLPTKTFDLTFGALDPALDRLTAKMRSPLQAPTVQTLRS